MKMEMKKLVMLIVMLASVALCIRPAFADDTHHHDKGAQEAQEQITKPSEKMSDHESMMQESLKKMHDQMEAIKHAKKPNERLKLLQEHSGSMRDSIKLMREIMGGTTMGGEMGSCHKMHGHSASHAAVPVSAEQIATPDKTSDKSAKQLWVCPMHPEVVQDHPGICPICGMDLVEMGQSGTSKSGHNHKMEGCMMGGGMKGGGMKEGCMMGGAMKGGMMEKHMDMMLMLMEQMIEHNDAGMAVQK